MARDLAIRLTWKPAAVLEARCLIRASTGRPWMLAVAQELIHAESERPPPVQTALDRDHSGSADVTDDVETANFAGRAVFVGVRHVRAKKHGVTDAELVLRAFDDQPQRPR